MKLTVLLLTIWTLLALVVLDGKVLAQAAEDDSSDATPTESGTAATPSASNAGLLGILGNPIGQLKEAFTIKGQPPKPHKPGSEDRHELKKEQHDKLNAEEHMQHEEINSSSDSDSHGSSSPKEKVVVEKQPMNAGTGITGNAAAGASSNGGSSRTGTGIGFDQVFGDNNSVKLTDGGGLLPSNSSLVRRSRQSRRSRQLPRLH